VRMYASRPLAGTRGFFVRIQKVSHRRLTTDSEAV
jgi:hypothetical protein